MSLSTKTLNTRISLKYDTWANWSKTDVAGQGANLVLKKGEIAFCEIPSGVNDAGVQNPPHIMYKVGDGTKTFSALPWGSAKAADVHAWAKESQSEFETRVSSLISSALQGDGVAITGYVTESDFNAFKTNIENRVKAIENDYTTASEAEAAAKAAADAVLGTSADTAGTATVHGALKSAAAADAKAEQNKTDIAAINTTISTTHATKTELGNAINGVIGTAEDTANDSTVLGAKKYTDQKIADFTTAYITDDGGTIDKLQEIAAWIADDKAGAAKLVNDVASLQENKLDKTEFNTFKTSDFKDVADKAHTHSNKTLLDTYTQTEANLADAVAKKHSHAKDMVEVTPEQVTAWDKVSEKASQADLNAHITNKNNPHEVTAAQVGAYTTEEADAKFATLAGLADGTTVAKEATHAVNADTATNATNATKATQDGNGHVIADTYETKSNVNALATRVSNLEGLDEFIIDCGSSTKNVF